MLGSDKEMPVYVCRTFPVVTSHTCTVPLSVLFAIYFHQGQEKEPGVAEENVWVCRILARSGIQNVYGALEGVVRLVEDSESDFPAIGGPGGVIHEIGKMIRCAVCTSERIP